MKKTLMHGLSEKDMQAVLNTFGLSEFVFPTLMPFKFTPTLSWKALSANLGAHVAADVVSFDATAPRKTRKVVARAQGDIPKIEIAREKGESALNDYNTLLHYANTSEGAKALLDFVYEDVEFCWNGINARLEWLALTAMSTGSVSLNSTNNNGIVTETAVDFLVPTANKKFVADNDHKWSAAATATPIANIKAIVKLAKAAGHRLPVMFMNQDDFDNMVATAEVQKFAASFALNATNLQRTPNLETLNQALRQENLPEIRIIDSLITIEKADGTQTTANPWAAGMVTFSPSIICGNTYHAPLADEMVKDSAAMKVKRNHAMIKRFSIEEPLKEVTKGMANAFPVWGEAQRSYILNTLATS